MAGPIIASGYAVKVDNVAVADVLKWTATPKIEGTRYVSSSTSSWKKTIGGASEVTGSFECYIQDSDGEPPVTKGQEITALDLSLDGVLKHSGPARISEVSIEADFTTVGPVKCTCTFESQGVWTGFE